MKYKLEDGTVIESRIPQGFRAVEATLDARDARMLLTMYEKDPDELGMWLAWLESRFVDNRQ